MTFDADPAGDTIDVNLETNTEYSVSIPDDAKKWISIAKSRSIRQETASLIISANDDVPRTAQVSFVNKFGESIASIQISQDAQSLKITNGTTYDINAEEGGTVSLKIESNVDYTVFIPDDAKKWVSLDNSQANPQETITLKICKNEGDARSVIIKILDKKGNTLASVEITQEKGISNPTEPSNPSNPADPTTIPSDMTKAFPDEIFRKYVLDNFDNNNDKVISKDEALYVTEISSIGRSWGNLKSLEGIQYFPNLNKLYVYGTNLTSLDLSRNTRLTSLNCSNNQLTTLDVSGCVGLKTLYCENNELRKLNLSNNTALSWLYCSKNDLTDLDVSKNTSLSWLECYENKLVALNVSKNTKLTGLDCKKNQLTELNVSNNRLLQYLYCGDNLLTTLDVTNNTKLVYIGHECFYARYRLMCDMPTLKKLYLKKGWDIPGINIFIESCPNQSGSTHLYDHNINNNTSIVYM